MIHISRTLSIILCPIFLCFSGCIEDWRFAEIDDLAKEKIHRLFVELSKDPESIHGTQVTGPLCRELLELPLFSLIGQLSLEAHHVYRYPASNPNTPVTEEQINQFSLLTKHFRGIPFEKYGNGIGEIATSARYAVATMMVKRCFEIVGISLHRVFQPQVPTSSP